MANIDNAYTVDTLSLDDNVLITSGTIDPSIGVGYEAPMGSLFLRTTGDIYKKNSTADVDWTIITSDLVKISSADSVSGFLDDKLLIGTSLTKTINNVGSTETITIDTTIPLSDIQTEIDNIEVASGGIFDTAGNYDGTIVDSSLSNVTGSTDLLNTLVQLNSAINVAGSTTTLNDLTDVTLLTPSDGQSLIYNVTSGLWENVTTTVITPGSGRLLQVKFASIPALAGTVSIPLTTADPLITQGVPLWNNTLTPTFDNSTVRVSTSLTASGSNNATELMITFFRNNVCIGAGLISMSSRDSGHPFMITIYDLPGTTSQLTYSCRIGKIAGNTWYVNRLSDAALLNSKIATQAYTIEEIGVI